MRRAPVIAAVLSALTLAALALWRPEATARGWLMAFLYCSGPLIGAVVLRLIGRLTGGGWSSAPGLDRLAAAAPWILPVGAPVLAAAVLIYPWAREPAPAPLVGYLSFAPFALRGALELGIWSGVALAAARYAGKAFAGGALMLYGVTVGFATVDFSLSTTPGWISSAAGMALADHQLMAALALALLLGGLDGRQSRDLAGLLIATLLADAYFNLLTYVVPWYGDQAGQTVFFRMREGAGWQALIAAALLIGDGAPLLILALAERRLGARTGAVAGGLALTGLALQVVWSLAPQLGIAAILPALAAGVLIVALLASTGADEGRVARA
jgi:hypothetical protein